MKLISCLFALLFLFGISGCSNSDSEDTDAQSLTPVSQGTAQVHVIHSSADAPTVNVLANGEVLEFLVGVDYQQS